MDTPMLLDRCEPGRFRIFIAATPKTGNVWLKHLLAATYGIPPVQVQPFVDRPIFEGLGEQWVAHQHLMPGTPILRMLREQRVLVLTVLRHPCDVLVSLRAYLEQLKDAVQREPRASRMLADGDSFGPATLDYVKTAFAAQVHLSLCWMRMGAIPVRYESLLSDPVGTLMELTNRISPVPESSVRAAVTLCHMDRMRRRHKRAVGHFRSGRSGSWNTVLPSEIIEAFRTTRPYPAQFRALGYTLDPPAEETTSAAIAVDPFQGATAFGNGVPIADFLIRVYFSRFEEASVRWPDPVRTTGDDTFFQWLNAPCDEDTNPRSEGLLLTNLGVAIYQRRVDLHDKYSDPFGANRLEFFNWLLLFAMEEFKLDIAFVAPMFEAMAVAESRPTVQPDDNLLSDGVPDAAAS